MVDFAKAGPEDTCIRISIVNRGAESASLHVLPHLWFRNDWWMKPDAPRPSVRQVGGPGKGTHAVIAAEHHELGKRFMYCDGAPELLFTENETNTRRLWNQPNAHAHVKDAFNDLLVHGARDAVNPAKVGTKSAAHYTVDVPAGGTAVIRLRLSDTAPSGLARPFADFAATFDGRKREADEFYAAVIPKGVSADRARVMRQALSGMLWTKQYYYFDLDRWLEEHHANPISGGRKPSRNREWFHMLNRHVISMPDKWEYPWYAAWDLAFHALALQIVDPDFAREQLSLTLSENYLHPNGQIPAYEWNFGDVNPPVHAWAVVFLNAMSKLRGESDTAFLKSVFPKLAQNFNWWINRKDPEGRSLFGGGFLGLR